MSECEVAVISHAQLDKIVRDLYRITRLLWASTLIDDLMFRRILIRKVISGSAAGAFILRAFPSFSDDRAKLKT